MLSYRKAVSQADNRHEIKNEYIHSPLAVTSIQYLLYLHYGIQENDSGSRVIYKVAQKSYLDFSRREFFQKSASCNDREACKKEIVFLLGEEIPELLKSKSHVEFDEQHHTICEKILRIYSPVDQYIVEAASCRAEGDFQHGLYLKCAPLKHEPFSPYEIDFYRNGEIQPYHLWEYEEYKEFQNAVRGKL